MLIGGAVYTRYQITPKIAIAGRAEYLSMAAVCSAEPLTR